MTQAAKWELGYSAFVDFEVWDLPGSQLEPESLEIDVQEVGAVIYVIDGLVRF